MPNILNQEAMVAFGETLGHQLKGGDLVLLSGTLGAGKTTLVKGVLKSLVGVDPDAVQSPTYSYVHPYSGSTTPVFHFDLYRLEKENSFFDLDLDAYLNLDSISLVEWPERVPSLHPLEGGRKIEVKISYSEEGRVVEVRGL